MRRQRRLPALQAGLQTTMTDVQWVIEAYALFLGALILVGGSAIEHVSWRAVFFLNLPFAIAVGALVAKGRRMPRLRPDITNRLARGGPCGGRSAGQANMTLCLRREVTARQPLTS